MFNTLIAISVGASSGALLRWFVTNTLNTLFPQLPPGTLTVNLVGGYLIGLALAWFASQPTLGLEWRLLIITGFLGSLTTFSTFSAEVVGLIHQDKWFWATATISAHVLGSLLMTVLGLVTMRLFQHS